jgi:uncharacterized protein YecT (DUF1311 family)
MLGRLALLIALLPIAVASGQASGSMQNATGPSFRCAGPLTPTESLICGDAELSAYDRAMAIARTRPRRAPMSNSEDQRAWLHQRDACGRQRSCVRASYQDILNELAPFSAGPSLRRTAMVRPDGSDLMLGALQSPTGRVRRLGDDAQLQIQSLGGMWYLFEATATHLYDPHDGRGANVSDSEAVGVIHVVNGSGTLAEDSAEPAGCSVRFTRLRRGAWRLVETGSCSGLGSTLSGIYGR